MLRNRLRACMLSTMIMTVTSHKGGVGKTTSALHLAAYYAREYGEGSTVLVDADPNASALEWAARGEENGSPLPFAVVDTQEYEGGYEHTIFDSQGRLRGEDLESAAYYSDFLVVPTSPGALSINALIAFIEDLEEVDVQGDYRVLLTMVHWWNARGGSAKRDLAAAGIPMFDTHVRLREAFETAALQGVTARDLSTKGGQQGWDDYERVGKEIVTSVAGGR